MPPTPDSSFGCFIDISSGAGGVEAMDWCSILFRMYTKWCDKHSYAYTITDETPGEVAGYKSISLHIPAANTYEQLKYESGIHRFCRNSPFNAQDKRQTSFSAVLVTPDIPVIDDEIAVNHGEYERDTFRAGGKGGQNVNKRDTAVRLVHKASGLVVECREERSQLANFNKAMKKLKQQLYDLRNKQQIEQYKTSYESDKKDVAFGHQIRSYFLTGQQLVKDERTKLINYNVDSVLNGDIDKFIESMKEYNAKKQELSL